MDPIDRAQAHELLNTADALEAHQRARAVERMRPRVKDCRLCGNSIAEARLAVLPYAQHCIYCAERTESIGRGVRRR